jgi:hypothetical protein
MMISLIIFLYLYDNEFTSRLVIYPMAVGVAIDAWKVSRRIRLRIFWKWALPWLGWLGDGHSAQAWAAEAAAKKAALEAAEEVKAIAAEAEAEAAGAGGGEGEGKADGSAAAGVVSNVGAKAAKEAKDAKAVQLQTAAEMSAGEQQTDDIDAQGMYYLKLALLPMVVLSALHSLYYFSYVLQFLLTATLP